MKKLYWLLTLPYIVTVTDLKICDESTPVNVACSDTGERLYHLNGFQDCISSSTTDCDYMYDISENMNEAHRKRMDENCQGMSDSDCEFYLKGKQTLGDFK